MPACLPQLAGACLTVMEHVIKCHFSCQNPEFRTSLGYFHHCLKQVRLCTIYETSGLLDILVLYLIEILAVNPLSTDDGCEHIKLMQLFL